MVRDELPGEIVDSGADCRVCTTLAAAEPIIADGRKMLKWHSAEMDDMESLMALVAVHALSKSFRIRWRGILATKCD